MVLEWTFRILLTPSAYEKIIKLNTGNIKLAGGHAVDCTGQNLRIDDKGVLQIQQGHLRIGTQELSNFWSALTRFIRNTRASRLPVDDALTLFNYNEEEPLTIRKVAYTIPAKHARRLASIASSLNKHNVRLTRGVDGRRAAIANGLTKNKPALLTAKI